MNKPLQRQLQTIVAGCCVCAALLSPRPGLAAPPRADLQVQARTVHLEVDVDELGDRGLGLDRLVREQLGARIAQANFELMDTGESAVTLRIRVVPLQSGEYDYGLHFDFIDEDRREPAIEWVDCHVCVDARLMPTIDEQTPALLAALDARFAAPDPDPAPLPKLINDSRADAPAPASELGEEGSKPPAISDLGIGSSVIVGLGIGALIAAGVELSDGVVVVDNGREHVSRLDHRPAGYALLGIGTTALIAGVVMLAVDLNRQAQKHEQTRARQAHLYPLFARDGAGLGVGARF